VQRAGPDIITVSVTINVYHAAVNPAEPGRVESEGKGMKTGRTLFMAATLLLSASLLWAGGSAEKSATSGQPVQITLGYSGGVWIEKYFDQVLSQPTPIDERNYREEGRLPNLR